MKKLVTGLFAIAITCTAMAQTQEKKAEPVKGQTEMQPGGNKGGELAIGDRRLVDPEGFNGHLAGWPLLWIKPVRPHGEGAAR